MTAGFPAPLQKLKGRFFLLLFLALAGFCLAADAPVAWDESQPVKLRGHRLEYFQEGQLLQGSGGVKLSSGPIEVSADSIELDLRSNTLTAVGNVVWSQEGNTVYAESVRLNLKTQLGSAKKLLFKRGAWAAWGESSAKTGEKDLSLESCEATSCMSERPHYRLRASEIEVRLGERVWLSNVVVYVGLAPLFYVPYYTQSLKDPRPPFEIRPGYNRQTGAFVRGAYNYYLTDDQWGSIRLDWMDKLGTGYGLSHHYRMLGGEGDLSGYATRDKNDPDKPSWSGNFAHRQELGGGMRLLGNVDMISQYRVNETYDLKQVDTFQNRSYLSLQSGQQDYAWSLGAGETQILQPKTFDLSSADREYVVTTRTLPSFTFSRYSKPLIPNTTLYWGVTGQLTRSLVVPTRVSGTVSLYDLGLSYYNDTVQLSPNLSHSLRLFAGTGLASNLSLSQGWVRDEGVDGNGRGITTGTLYEIYRIPFSSSFNSELGWRYSRQLSQPENLRFSGVLDQRLTFNSNWAVSDAINLMGNTDYDLLPYRVDSDLKRLGLVRLQGNYSPSDHKSLSLVSAYHAHTGQVKSIDSSINLNGDERRWQLAAGSSWINNRILLRSSPLDINAPASYAYEEPRRTPDQLLLNWRASFAATENWGLSLYSTLR